MLAAGKADIMLSGGRTQFIALKAKTPWLDINQERHHPYAGYDGMVELVRQIDLAIHNPAFAAVRAPAPWDLPAKARVDAFDEAPGSSPQRARSSRRPPPTTWASARACCNLADPPSPRSRGEGRVRGA